jgi:hypothetical protein
MVSSAFGLQALQDIERRQRSTCLLDQPAIAQSASLNNHQLKLVG